MDDTEVVRRAAGIFSSDCWWKPVLGFIITNCGKFTGRQFTNEEHECFVAFRKLFTELFDAYVSKKIGVTSTKLEGAFSNALANKDKRVEIIMTMLRNYSDFVYFRDEMVGMSEKVKDEATKRMIEIHEKMERGEDTMDVAAWLEEGEHLILERECNKKVCQMLDELRVTAEQVPASRARGGSFEYEHPSPRLGVKASQSRSQAPLMQSCRSSLNPKAGKGLILKPSVAINAHRGV
jgi:hypothetical protein